MHPLAFPRPYEYVSMLSELLGELWHYSQADRSLRKLENCMVERYRIDLADLAMHRATSLQVESSTQR